ncbi:MAG: M20/M25/M40 family metallo-hydrolase [Clostridia bacterium]|nr:M20/M25/M40 family metallo-hydrolase [Clostridia bacterium]
MELIETLCRIPGVTGDEAAVAAEIECRMSTAGCETSYDKMGNLIVKKKGKMRPKTPVTLYAHMDEVGLIISKIDKDGFLRFKTVGGIDPRVLLSKTVFVGEKRVRGVIGVKAVHLQTKEAREKAPETDKMYIDIGARDEEDAKNHVRLGDFASFDDDIVYFGQRRVCAKALDDRAGCAAIIETLSGELLYDAKAVFTVGEEIGTRGARVGAAEADGGVAVIIETTTCADFDGVPENKKVTRLGEGPAISFIDNSTFYDPALVRFALSCATENDITHQVKKSGAGGNDAGAVSQGFGGHKVLSVSMPCRYLHSPSSVISLDDYDNTKRLIAALIIKLGEQGYEY